MTPLVSVVLCHHDPANRKYLDACVKSLWWQEGVDIEVILISSYFVVGLPNNVKQTVAPEGYRWVHKANLGVSLTDPKSKYLLLLNDDVILAKHTIESMSRKLGDFGLILNPMSQCDNGWLFNAKITLTRYDEVCKDLTKRFYAFEELQGFVDSVIHHPRGMNLLHPENYVCFYATMIPRAVWNAVGPLDEKCRTSHDDEDYCYRAKKLGIISAIDFESFALHFGGATSASTTTDADREETHSYFNQKWGRH